MRKVRTGIVSLLLLALLLSAVPITALATYEVDEDTNASELAGTPSLQSMMPLNEVRKTLDLTGYLPHELKAFPVATIMELMGMEETPAVYTRWYYFDENGDWVDDGEGNYKKLTASDTLDLSLKTFYGSYLELIGGTADQLDLNNKRYIAYIETSGVADFFTPVIYTKDRQEATALFVTSNSTGMTSDFEAFHIIDIYANLEDPAWSYLTKKVNEYNGYEYYAGEYYLGLTLNDSLENVNVKIVKYGTGEDVTNQLLNQSNMANTGGLKCDVEEEVLTFTFWRDNEAESTSFTAGFYVNHPSLSVNAGTLYGNGNDYYRDDVTYTSIYEYDGEYVFAKSKSIEYVLDSGMPVDGTYYIYFVMNGLSDMSTGHTHGIEYVEKAVVGDYDSLAAIPASAQDIKDQLFSDADEVGGGYGADFSNGVTFTIIDTFGGVHKITIKAIAYETWTATQGLSQSTYFNVNTVEDFSAAESGWYSLPEEDDTYSEYGYQTMFLLGATYNETERKWVYSPVTDSTIVPYFWKSDMATIYASVDGGSAKKQVSGESQIPFTAGKAIQYTAVAEDGEHLANYWVTFLTQQTGGPKLFVNATNNPSHYATVDGQQLPQREVYLSSYYDNKHDIAFANVGDTVMEGLYVRLENAQNVALDDYWTIKDTKTLSPFTTVQTRDSEGNYLRYGGLANIAKIRLVPETDANGEVKTGEVSGTLVIGYTGTGTEPVEEVRIHLTGFAGDPQIATSYVLDGVKYVPYSSMLQTNVIHATDAVQFSISSGKLPDGLTLKSTGEICGVPTTPGDYKFTVKATFGSNENVTSKKEYTLTILDNTKENVLAVNDSDRGYKLLDAVPETVNMREIPADGYVFRSEGAFNEFMAFYLDGNKLERGKDYTAEEGSTRIVIQAQTFKNAGSGTHTIAAEFRAGGAADGEMKSTAQNVTVSGVSGSTGGGSRGNTTSSSTGLGLGNHDSAVDVLTAAANRIAGGDRSYVTELRTGAISDALSRGNGITVSVEQVAVSRGQVSSDDLSILDKRLGTAGSVNTYMSLKIVIKDATTGEVLGYLSQLPGSIQFTVDVPQSMLDAQKNGKFIYVIRVHDGKAEFLSTTIRDGKAYFTSDRFSTYALVLTEAKVGSAQTGDMGVMLYAAMALLSCTGGAGAIRGRKKR